MPVREWRLVVGALCGVRASLAVIVATVAGLYFVLGLAGPASSGPARKNLRWSPGRASQPEDRVYHSGFLSRFRLLLRTHGRRGGLHGLTRGSVSPPGRARRAIHRYGGVARGCDVSLSCARREPRLLPAQQPALNSGRDPRACRHARDGRAGSCTARSRPPPARNLRGADYSASPLCR